MGIQNNFYPKIFLSCSFHDSRHPVIERLIYKLIQKGASVLRAAEVLNTGNSIAEKIHTVIDDSDYVLIAL